MFDTLDLDTILIVLLIGVAVGGLVYALLYPRISSDARRSKRLATLAPAKRAAKSSTERGKRISVEDALKEIEERKQKAKRLPLQTRLAQAGLEIPKKKFMMICAGAGLLTFVAAYLLFDLPLMLSLALVGVAGFVVPIKALDFLSRRRINQFLEALPDAIDIIVRGVKAGLPLGDCMRIVAMEAREPVRGEFLHVLNQQTMGKPLYEAVTSIYERMPLPESNFFAIVVSIQQKAGGNLSESLGNLSKVLRERKKMKMKIVAMSQEAKASAAIIGCLPLAVMALVYWTTPSYIELLWTTETGHIMIAACLAWMGAGVFIMRQMIQFDF